MRVAVISDIHANYDALAAIVAETASEKVDRFVCLGDVVGYYAEPQRCVDLVREMDMLVIQGNHDAVAGGLEEPHAFNVIATDAIMWTREKLNKKSRAWLAGLPIQGQITPEIWIVHGSLRDRDEYLLDQNVVRGNFEVMARLGKPRTTLFGHTHRRAAYRWCMVEKNVSTCATEGRLKLNGSGRYLINPGGCGQPRDGVPGAPYAIIEDDEIEFRRAPYDVHAAAAKVAALPFGQRLAERLELGV